MNGSAPILVAACGNAMAGADAFGSLVARELAAAGVAGVETVDMGMNPAGLLDHLEGRNSLIIVDAALAEKGVRNLFPGALTDMDYFSPQRPALLSERGTSTHALSVAGQLDLARVLGMLPPVVRLVAAMVDEAHAGDVEAVRGRVAEAVALILRRVDAEKDCV